MGSASFRLKLSLQTPRDKPIIDHQLTPAQQQWIDRTLNSLSLEHAILQLFDVSRPIEDPAVWLTLLERWPAGCLSARTKTAAAYQQLLSEVQKQAAIPLVVVANMEHGASEWPDYGTDFPMLMAAGAANDEALIAQLGEATAITDGDRNGYTAIYPFLSPSVVVYFALDTRSLKNRSSYCLVFNA